MFDQHIILLLEIRSSEIKSMLQCIGSLGCRRRFFAPSTFMFDILHKSTNRFTLMYADIKTCIRHFIIGVFYDMNNSRSRGP